MTVCLDVSWCCRLVACEDIAPVSLGVHQQLLLPELHQGIADAGIAVRMELHGVAHDVGHLIISSVVHPLHGVEDATLYGLEAVADMWHGTIQDGVRGVVQKPGLVHAVQMVGNAILLR